MEYKKDYKITSSRSWPWHELTDDEIKQIIAKGWRLNDKHRGIYVQA